MNSEVIPGCAFNLPVETLSAWRDRALPDAEARRVAAHVASCPACRQRLAEYDAVTRALKTLTVPEPVGGYGRNPRLRTDHAGSRVWARLRRVPPGGLGAVAAALLIAVLFGGLYSLFRIERGPATIRADAFALTDPTLTLGHITPGPGGNLYFTAGGKQSNAIGRITPSGTITLFPLAADAFTLKTPVGGPGPIIAEPDGNLWFAENGSGKLARLSPDGQHLAEFPFPIARSAVSGLAVGPDGNLWFTIDPFLPGGWVGTGEGKIGRITPDGGSMVEFALPSSTAPLDITRGPDGNLWFSIQATDQKSDAVGRISADGRSIATFSLPAGGADRITSGPDGALWFSEGALLGDHGSIGRVTISGSVSEFPLPQLSGAPVDIVAGPDGNLWFTVAPPDCSENQRRVGECPQAHALGRITPTGNMSIFPLPGQSMPLGIALGADDNLWITATDPAVIYRAPPRAP